MNGLEQLHHIFAQTAQGFAAVKASIEGYEALTREKVDALERCVSGSPLIPEQHPLKKVVDNLRTELEGKASAWTKMAKSHDKNTEFREDYGDSLLLYIFGQVKSGKSSLGNLLIHGKHDPKESETRPVTLKMHDESGKKNLSEEEFQRTKKFKIDYVEATSAIQVLKIPGLTLVDSPGIHSVTKENGKLADEYLDCADLVLFMAKSPSYCTRSEAYEIKTIHEKGKEFLIIVPRCDEVLEDENAEGEIIRRRVMKNKEGREKIITWCKKSVADVLTEEDSPDFLSGRVLPISCLYAEENPDAEGWQQSGLADLTRKLTEIAKGEGVGIKRKVPLENLQSYNRAIVEPIAPLRKELESAKRDMAEFRAQIREEAEACARGVNRKIRGVVLDAVNTHVKNDSEIKKSVEQGLRDILKDVAAELAEKAHAAGEKLTKELKLPSVDFPSVEDILSAISYPKASKGAMGLGAVLGGIGGFLLGGPLGAGLGASLGAGAGNALGREDCSEMEVIGDNRDTVVDEITEKLRPIARSFVDGFANDFANKPLVPLENWIGDLERLFEQTAQELEAQNKRMEDEIRNKSTRNN